MPTCHGDPQELLKLFLIQEPVAVRGPGNAPYARSFSLFLRTTVADSRYQAIEEFKIIIGKMLN